MENRKFIEAVGVASTICPDMEIDVNDPVGMMKKVCVYVAALRARIAELEKGNSVMKEER